MRDRFNWKLKPSMFHKIPGHFQDLSIDHFTSLVTFQVRCFFIWRPDPMVEAMDTFLSDWRGEKAFDNPQWNIVGRALMKVEKQVTYLVLVEPV